MLHKGDRAKVKKIYAHGPLKRRMMDMGFVRDQEVSITRLAPLGDPMQISIRGYELSIRKEDAKWIEVE